MLGLHDVGHPEHRDLARVRQRAGDRREAVAVGVGLDDGKDADTRSDRRTHGGDVVADRGEIDLGPTAGQGCGLVHVPVLGKVTETGRR